MFTVGQKLTVIRVNGMAMCQKNEIKVTDANAASSFVHAVQRGKRKSGIFKVGVEMLVFDGWDLPISTDFSSGAGMIHGNACFNLVGDAATIKDLIDTKNLNTAFDRKGECLLIVDGKETLLYPEVETHHAVIERLKMEQEVA